MSLCPNAAARAAMTDDEFWEHVSHGMPGGWNPDPDPEDDLGDPQPLGYDYDAEPCPVCGEVGACMFDAEGRPLIHTTTEERA